jgi:hypothetical protein
MPPISSASPPCSTHRCIHHQPLELNHMTCSFSNTVFFFSAWVLFSISRCWHRGHDLLVLCSDALRARKCSFAAHSMLSVGDSPSSHFPDAASCPPPYSIKQLIGCASRFVFSILSRMAWNSDSTIFRLLMSIDGFRCLVVCYRS